MRYVLLVLIAGCGLDRNIEGKITIHQGVYGLLVDQDLPVANAHLVVLAAGQRGTYADATSDRDGVYQIELPVADFTLCTSSCTPITVQGSATVRYDWTSGPGGGHWERL